MKKSVTIERKAEAWVRRLAKEYGISDAGGELVLEELERALITELRTEAILAREGHHFADRFGQRRVHPLAAVARDARSQVLAAVKALSIDLEPLHDGIGRPGGMQNADD